MYIYIYILYKYTTYLALETMILKNILTNTCFLKPMVKNYGRLKFADIYVFIYIVYGVPFAFMTRSAGLKWQVAICVYMYIYASIYGSFYFVPKHSA